MSQIINGKWERHESNKNSSGGTELLMERLFNSLPEELTKEVQIIASRMPEEIDETKIRIYWAHDLIGDPESDKALKDEGWRDFHRIVFVSNWQMQRFIEYYHIPWSKCVVIQNGIQPIEKHEKPTDTTRLVYFSTPHRGLELLVPVFSRLAEEMNNIELDVYSSFEIYGWKERDKPYEQLFETCKAHPKINYHGSVSNDEVREGLKQAHILAYPSIWQETSCMVLMEAMSAGLICVHSNLAALYETGANWTSMYQFHEDPNEHASVFYAVLKNAILAYNHEREAYQSHAGAQKTYVDAYYKWDSKAYQWEMLIKSMLSEPRELPKQTGPVFEYKTS